MWRFKKGLYGLVQAGRTWNEELNAHMEGEGFTETPKDPMMYIKNSCTDRDFAAAGDSCGAIGSRRGLTALAESVNAKYGMTGLGEVRWALGMLLERDRPARTISIFQEAFIDSVLARFNLTDATPVATPLTPGTHLSTDDGPASKDEIEEVADRPYREVVEALMWLALGTRLDIAFATSSLARFARSRPLRCGQTSITLPQNSGVSCWEASPRRLQSSEEVTVTTDTQSEHIPSRSEMGSSAGS